MRNHRQRFNASFTPEKYRRFLQLLEERAGEPPRFRHSETPVFLSAELVDRMAQAGREMVEQLLANPEYRRASSQAIPERYRVPNEASVPLFVQADFGIDDDLNPKLVEIQGFPSLYAWQPTMAECYRDAYGIDPALSAFPSGLDSSEYHALLRKAIVAGHDPENVVLLEIDPENQKTHADFVMTERMFGVKSVDIAQVRKVGNSLVVTIPADVAQQHGIKVEDLVQITLEQMAVLPKLRPELARNADRLFAKHREALQYLKDN